MSDIDFAVLPLQQALDGLLPAERDAHTRLAKERPTGLFLWMGTRIGLLAFISKVMTTAVPCTVVDQQKKAQR